MTRKMITKIQPNHNGKRRKSWQNYEDVARYVLEKIGKQFGISEVQGKQKVPGRKTGTVWEIDAKGILANGCGIVLVECRRHKHTLSQEAIAAVAFRIENTGAQSGIIVSPLPLQKGAAKVAAARSIKQVQLTPESNFDQWIATIGNVVNVGLTDRLTSTITDSVKINILDQTGDAAEEISLQGQLHD